MIHTNLDAAGKTDAGCVRTNNEDSLWVDSEIGLLVVADGMGGHNSGEVASGLATSMIRECARDVLSGKEPVPASTHSNGAQSARVKQMEYMIQKANRVIYEKGHQNSKDEGMGTTIVAALVDEEKKMITVAHVGDSRLYLFRNGRLQSLTQDHSLVMDQVRRGIITAEEAENSNFQNILTRALGSEQVVIVDVAEHPMLEGDVVLLCTDGLTKMLSDGEITSVLAKEDAPATVCERLVAAAIKAGGADNVTTVAARIPKSGPLGIRNLLNRIFHGR